MSEALLIFIAAAIVIAISGTLISGTADRLADQTGLGEALFGAILLGGSTSLSGSVLSIKAAYDGEADLAISNAIGGIAAQTFFLCIADVSYRKANLEHAAASSTNLMSGMLLITLLSFALLADFLSIDVFFTIHPLTPFYFLFYIFSVHYISQEKERPMWFPKKTPETKQDLPREKKSSIKNQFRLWAFFSLHVILLIGSGLLLENSGLKLAASFGIAKTTMGSLFTAIITSFPELITTLAAVRRGALTLAVGGIVGGNTFDVLMLPMSDIFYRAGDIYNQISEKHSAIIVLSILLTALLCLGLIRREKHGIGGIGSESVAMAILYIGGMTLILT